MPKLNCESKNLDIFWKDLAKDIITPFAPKNHSILRYLHRNSPRKNSPKIVILFNSFEDY